MDHQGNESSRVVRGVAVGAVTLFMLLFVASVRAQEEEVAAPLDDALLTAGAFGTGTLRQNPDFDIDRVAHAFEYGILHRWHSYCATADDLVRDFHFWQNFLLPIAPPSPGYIFYAQRNALRVFDPAEFPPQMLAGLVPEAYRDVVYVYRVTVVEDPTTRERVFYNANTNEIWRQAAPEGYDPWRYWHMIERAWTLRQQRGLASAIDAQAIYDPARIRCEYLLLPTNSLPVYAMYCAIAANNAALERALNPPAMMMSMYTPAATDFVFTDIVVTNGIVDMGIHLPDGTSCRVDLFYKEFLIYPWWSLGMTTATNSGTFRIQVSCSLSNAFFRAGNADVDTDGDGIPDDRELLTYGTDPTKPDTDGDGVSDFEEIFTYQTDPTKWDTDGDGMSDGWELAHGYDPLDPNDLPNVSGTILYSGRQTGVVWVVAVTSSNSWATNNAVLLSGPGSYLIPNLFETNYYLKAWMDTTNDGVPGVTEAVGIFANTPICVTNQVTGRDIALIDPDTDSDGLPDWWEVKYFGSITNYTRSDTPDDDEYTNLEEYNAGTDPTNAVSHPWGVSGTILYSGPQTGTIYVIASASSVGWTAVGSTTLSSPGAYTITCLPPDTCYWIKAYRDSGGGGSNIFWEAWGTCANNPVYLNTNTANEDITLDDPDHDGDGFADWWEVLYGLDPFYPGIPDGGWWKMDESAGTTVQDSSGHGNAGAFQNMSSCPWTNGAIGNGLSFDGVSGYVQVEDAASLKANYVSAGLWVKVAQDLTNGAVTFLSKKQPDGATGYRLSYEQGSLSFLVCASGERSVSWPCALTNGDWHHIFGTYGGNNHRLYVDGILRANTNYDWGLGTGQGHVDQGTTVLRLGASTDATPTNFFFGTMDDVRVYGRELSSNEVHAAYELGGDADGDGLLAFQEYQLGTNPGSADTDGDGLSDMQEHQLGTNPVDANDPPAMIASISGTVSYSGALPGMIYVVAVTTSNSWSMAHAYRMATPGPFILRDLPATNYWIKTFRDVDGDVLSDNWQPDVWEPLGIAAATPVEVSSRVTGESITLRDPDTDGDGLTDYEELFVYFTDRNNPDTDGDGLTDWEEIMVYHTSPFSNDSDFDHTHDSDIHDAQEIAAGLNPLLVDSDGDGIDDKTETDTTGLDPTNPADGVGDLDGDGFSNYTEYIDDWPMRTAASSNDTARYTFVCRFPGLNHIRFRAGNSGTAYSCMVMGDAGITSTVIRIPPTKQIGATVVKRLYHTSTPGIFLNGTSLDSLASPINVPDSGGTAVYQVTASPSAQGTSATIWLGDDQGHTNTSAVSLQVSKVTSARVEAGDSSNYIDVQYAQTGTLYVTWAPDFPLSSRVRINPSIDNCGGVFIRDSEYPLASVSGSVTNYSAHLDWRDYRSARTGRRGLPLPVGHHRVAVGLDFNMDQTLQTEEESFCADVYVVKVDLGIMRTNGTTVSEAEEPTAGSVVQLTAKTNRAGVYLNLVGPTVEPSDVRDQLSYRFITSTPLYCGGKIRLYRNGVLYKDDNISETNVAPSALDATWTVDATVGGVVDLALVAYKPNGWEVARDTVRINAIACPPAGGDIKYAYPNTSAHVAPYTWLECGAATIGAALPFVCPGDNLLISPASSAYQEHGLVVSSPGVIAGLAGKWLLNDPATNAPPLADYFDYSGLPDIQPGSTNTVPIFYLTGEVGGPDCFRVGGLRLRNGRAFVGPPEGGAFYAIDMTVPLIVTGVKFDGNQSRWYGGAVSLHHVTCALFDTCYFNNNLCEYDDGGSVCYAKGMGGGIAAFASSLLVTNSTFNGNTARVVKDGGIPTTGSAGGGGDVYCQGSTLTFVSSKSTSAVAGRQILPGNLPKESFTGDGGSILMHGTFADSRLTVSGAKFSESVSYGNGGAISLSKDASPEGRGYFVTMLGGLWPPSSPAQLSGGCNGVITNTTFYATQGGWQGGAISANGRGMQLDIVASTFDQCKGGTSQTRDGKGGAVSVGGGVQRDAAPQNNVFLRGCHVSGCKASGNGGGLYVTIRGKLQLSDTDIESCLALDEASVGTNDFHMISGMGGGIHASAGGYVYLQPSGTGAVVLALNAAHTSGGGLSVKSGKAFILGNADIYANEALGDAPTGYGNGGGVFVTTSYHDDTFAGGAGTGAAVLFNENGYLVANYPNVAIRFNEATRWGGGVYAGISPPWYGTPANYDSAFLIYRQVVSNNVASTVISGTSFHPSQIAVERVQSAYPFTAFMDFAGSFISGNPSTDVGIYAKTSDSIATNGVLFCNLNTNLREDP